MEKINCIIIDDEPLGRDLVESFAKEVSYLNILGIFENPVTALSFLEENPVDLVFSDIEMPKINGLDFLRTLENPPVFIFITAYREFALDGFDTGATDYLVKPVRFDRFLKAIQKAKNHIDLKRDSTNSQNENDKIFIKSEGKIIKILLSEILYIEAQGDYLNVVTTSEIYSTQMTLTAMEENLQNKKFFRIQRSFILNLDFVRSIHGNMVELLNGKSISVSVNKKDELRKLLGM
ncbi:two component transcriptional regulator, LytTR family [Epilithonimonas bovis DSM 19482]|uniref:Two component transcriptional regulator, LytTR family n=1 Tax=Epilithonimonas bovis DSM 19482 TaxID=1121284 RepID=A0A1U7PZS5_9FLAO|nr:LytTR family DNA-binding domain-containing protein [Epilithonimonas bovis]QIY84727.1 response regulator transcription factor [Chryseobacterium sp. NEB161]SIT97460.1 two component transcriptional regulator, LytTR family [Epilithonimonas bovis DSM 19482]